MMIDRGDWAETEGGRNVIELGAYQREAAIPKWTRLTSSIELLLEEYSERFITEKTLLQNEMRRVSNIADWKISIATQLLINRKTRAQVISEVRVCKLSVKYRQ